MDIPFPYDWLLLFPTLGALYAMAGLRGSSWRRRKTLSDDLRDVAISQGLQLHTRKDGRLAARGNQHPLQLDILLDGDHFVLESRHTRAQSEVRLVPAGTPHSAAEQRVRLSQHLDAVGPPHALLETLGPGLREAVLQFSSLAASGHTVRAATSPAGPGLARSLAAFQGIALDLCRAGSLQSNLLSRLREETSPSLRLKLVTALGELSADDEDVQAVLRRIALRDLGPTRLAAAMALGDADLLDTIARDRDVPAHDRWRAITGLPNDVQAALADHALGTGDRVMGRAPALERRFAHELRPLLSAHVVAVTRAMENTSPGGRRGHHTTERIALLGELFEALGCADDAPALLGLLHPHHPGGSIEVLRALARHAPPALLPELQRRTASSIGATAQAAEDAMEQIRARAGDGMAGHIQLAASSAGQLSATPSMAGRVSPAKS